jgi:hypothetical protein
LGQARGLSGYERRLLIFPTVLIVAAYPFIDVAFGSATFHSSFAGSKYVTQGDVLIVAAQMLIGEHYSNDELEFSNSLILLTYLAMYVFELFYRPKISPVSVGHHIGTIMIGQSAIAISLNYIQEKDATIEFTLCTIWGKPSNPSSHSFLFGANKPPLKVPSILSPNSYLMSR